MRSRLLSGARRRLFLVPLAAAAIAVLAAFSTVRASDDDLPTNLRLDLEAAVKARIGDLVAEKDAEGAPLRRAEFSKTFRKVNDTTYEVSVHRDTIEAGSETKDPREHLKTERMIWTLTKDAKGAWKVSKEDVKDTFVGLYRTVVRSSEMYSFQKFTFEKEGMKISATGGNLYKRFQRGRPVGFTLVADDLAYEYAPPADAGYPWYEITARRIAREHPEDIVFKPEWLRFSCDPTTCEDVLAKSFAGLVKLGGDQAEGPAKNEVPSKAGEKIRKLFDDNTKEAEKRYKENPFPSFTLPYEDDRRTWNATFKRLGGMKEHYAGLDYDNYEPWEVSFFASGYFPRLFAYYSEDTRKSKIPPYELERRDDPEARDIDLHGVKGTVDVALDDPETLSGDVTFTMVIKRELKLLPFAISRVRFPGADQKESKNPKLFINSIQDEQGQELTFVKRGGFGGLVAFPKPIAAGTKIVLRMQFTNKDGIYALNPSYSAMDRGGWLPFVRFSDQVEDFDLTVRVPEKYKVLGICKKVSESTSNGVNTTRWVATNPVSFPTIIFGQYIEAPAKIVAKKSDGTVIPVNVYVDTVSASAINQETVRTQKELDDVMQQAESGARDIRAGSLSKIGDQAVNALNLYREIYGVDYPYDKLDLVADPLGSFYGQSPSSLIYLGFGVFYPEGRIANMSRRSSYITKFNKDVVAHETGHQWWGSTVNNANFRNYWFVESLAELSSALFVENVYGKKQYQEKIKLWRETILDADLMSSVQNGYALWAGETDGGFSPQANIYNKGPFAFHILRETFGDEKFFEFLKRLAQECKRKEIVTRDIQRVMEESYGVSMEWFFDQWIRGVGIPQYALNYTKRQTEDGKWIVQGTIKQRVVVGKEKDEMKGVYYRAVAPLTFVFADGKRMDTAKPILVQGPETPFALKIPQEPVEVLFNAENEILAHDVLVNKSGW